MHDPTVKFKITAVSWFQGATISTPDGTFPCGPPAR
jgi:hypothetical protein